MFDRIKEDAGRRLSDFTDQDHSRRRYLRIAGAGLGINCVSWIVGFLTPEAIAEWVGLAADISDRLKTYLLAVPFWSMFFACYSFLRLARYSNPTDQVSDDEVMASFRDSEKANYVRNRVLLSLAVAALNTVLLVVFILWFR